MEQTENQHCPRYVAYFGAESEYLESDDDLTRLLLVLLNEGAADSHDVAIWENDTRLIACVVSGELKILQPQKRGGNNVVSNEMIITGGYNSEIDAVRHKATKLVSKPRPPRLLTHNGVTKTLTEWAKDKGLSKMCLFLRLKNGWNLQAALETPARQSKRTPDVSQHRTHRLRN